MSRILSPTLAAVPPYTPGEQPQDQQYIKLNTNESPYLPSPAVSAAGSSEATPIACSMQLAAAVLTALVVTCLLYTSRCV